MSSLAKSIIFKSKSLFRVRNGIVDITRNNSGAKLSAPTHRVNDLEKRFLVWTGKYKNVQDVPNHVNQNVVERARNRMRIRVSNYMMAATAFGFIGMAYLGKLDALHGRSLTRENIEWHKRTRDEANIAKAINYEI